jgi:hypothetical protein
MPRSIPLSPAQEPLYRYPVPGSWLEQETTAPPHRKTRYSEKIVCLYCKPESPLSRVSSPPKKIRDLSCQEPSPIYSRAIHTLRHAHRGGAHPCPPPCSNPSTAKPSRPHSRLWKPSVSLAWWWMWASRAFASLRRPWPPSRPLRRSRAPPAI